MTNNTSLQVQIVPYSAEAISDFADLEQNIYDLNSQIEMLSSKADTLDYLVSVASGILCGTLDILWVGDFDLNRGTEIADKQIHTVIIKISHLLGHKSDDLNSCIRFLEKKFPLASDGNENDFGGGKQHHFRDFAHHPTILGLIFSLLTQFTEKSFGTDTAGNFRIYAVPESSKWIIGRDLFTKIFYGTVIWFFHLVSDMAGSSSSAGTTGGAGIPGPILSLAKELAALLHINNIKIDDYTISQYLSKLFNGTLFAKHDANNRIIKDTVHRFDLRAELGIGLEFMRESIPVIANDCLVRVFYFIRQFAMECKDKHIHSISDMSNIDWDTVKPINNPTLDRMLLIATGVFTTIDITEAFFSPDFLVAVNYAGVGRFAVAIGKDVIWFLKKRDIQKIKQVYENIQKNMFRNQNNKIYEELSAKLHIEKLCLSTEQTILLYNLQYYKISNDIRNTKVPAHNEAIKSLKREWLAEWKTSITNGFPEIMNTDEFSMQWYTLEETLQRIADDNPQNIWFRLILVEAMAFHPYFTLGFETNKKGKQIPCRKYLELNNPLNGYKENIGDAYLEQIFSGKSFYQTGYIARARKSYRHELNVLNEKYIKLFKSLAIATAVAVPAIILSNVFAPQIAVALVGSHFATLHGAALTSACLAYLGGGAIAIGGAGVAGGVSMIVGGGAVLGLGIGVGTSGMIGNVYFADKQNTVLQFAKLLVTVKEIFLKDEKDFEFAHEIYRLYAESIDKIEKDVDKTKKSKENLSKYEKETIHQIERNVKTMKIAENSLLKIINETKDMKLLSEGH